MTIVVYRIVWFDLKCLPSDVWSLEAKDQNVSSFCQEETVVSALVEMRLVFLVIRFHPTHCADNCREDVIVQKIWVSYEMAPIVTFMTQNFK